MIDTRYHVISLVAVFLALGIGILLGTTLVERGLIAEQKGQISSLKKTFDEIREKNKSLNDELDVYQEYAAQSEPFMLANRIPGLQFAAISKKDPDEDALGSIHEAIGNGGGNVPLTLTVSGDDVFDDPVVVNALAGLFVLPPDPAVLRDRVFFEVIEQFKNASNPGILANLEQVGVIKIRGTLPGSLSGVVLLGAIDEGSPDSVDVPLIRTAVASGFPIVGVGGSKTEDSVMEKYKKTGISTVEHVETEPGRVALVLVLAGNSGNYGIGKSASRVIPQPPGI